MTVVILILLIPIAWFLQNIIHEASHLLIGYLVEGREPLKLIFWPTRHKGRLYFARYVSGPPTKKGSSSMRHIAPFFAGLIWSFIASLFYIVISIYCVPFVMAGLIDSGFFWYTHLFGSEDSDGQRYKRNSR